MEHQPLSLRRPKRPNRHPVALYVPGKQPLPFPPFIIAHRKCAFGLSPREARSYSRTDCISLQGAFDLAGPIVPQTRKVRKQMLSRAAPLVPDRPRLSLPLQWFRDPLYAAIKKFVRPATSTTRRSEIRIRMACPIEVFEELMAELAEGDCKGLRRDPASQKLVPTRVTESLNHFQFEVRRGSVTDRLFKLQTLDPPPPRQRPALMLAQIGEPGVYEVEAIRAKRMTAKRVKYLIKWVGYSESHNTWEAPSNINTQLVAAFEASNAPVAGALVPPSRQSSLPNRGQGAARAHLSAAAQRRGGVPTVLSMACGNISVNFKQSKTEKSMPVLTLTFKVLTMDNTGHMTWPVEFATATKAALRLQARSLLRKMMDDPLNPCDASFELAMTGMGTSSLWQAPPARRMVWVQPTAQ